MKLKKRKKNQFEMFKVFKIIMRKIHFSLFNYNEFNLTVEDFICFVNLMQLQIFDYFLYKIFKKGSLCKDISNINYYTYQSYLHYRFSTITGDVLCVGSFNKNKFYWTNFSYNPVKFFNVYKNNFKCSSNLFISNKSDKLDVLYDLVNFKKQLGFIKKKDRQTYNTLINVNFLKNFKYFNKFSIMSKTPDFSKMFDLKRKTLRTFIKNRDFFKGCMALNTTRQYKLTKFISKNDRFSVRDLIKNIENSVIGILIKSKFVFTVNDALFLVKNSFVYLNNSICTNPFSVAKPCDMVCLVFSDKYFRFYKSVFNYNLKLSSFLSYRLWRYNRFRMNFYKQSPTALPEWINKLCYTYNDVPLYLEVDYITLSSVVLWDEFNNSLYFSKVLNVFLFRLYNWKYVN